ncbi:hypothetical protein HUS70_18515 [Pandoraea nosoerga]|nr:hypothetical protein [Pandoraea nosoerga]MBN4746599.1 hypothetical protein [Pandoraea nosoerga]
MSLTSLAARREAGLRAALARLTAAAREAGDALAASEREHARLREVWQQALARGGVYARREAAQVSREVEQARAALAHARARAQAAHAQWQQAQAQLQEQRERLYANARKQEKLRALLAQRR